MADTKLSALGEITTAAIGDYLYIVDDPAGTPVSKAVTITKVFASAGITVDGTSIDAPAALVLQDAAHANVTMFGSAASGETPALTISGFKSGDALRTLSIGIGPNANQAVISGPDWLALDCKVSVGVTAQALGAIHAQVDGASDGIPCAYLRQKDVSEPMVTYRGTSSETDASQSLVDAATLTTPGAIVGWTKVYVQDDQSTGPITDGVYYVPFYAAPTA